MTVLASTFIIKYYVGIIKQKTIETGEVREFNIQKKKHQELQFALWIHSVYQKMSI